MKNSEQKFKDIFKMTSDCCESTSDTDECSSMMAKCMKGCRWCPIIPVILGTILLLLGYFLNPETIRVLWLILSGVVVLMGLFCLIAMNIISRK